MGLFGVVGSTPVLCTSERQPRVQMSTFGAKITALKKGDEEAIALRYHLKAMGVKVSKPTPIFVDNMSVVLNASNPGITLNKKTVALSYNFVNAAINIVEFCKINSVDHFADPFTKSM
eukprot:8256772-Ditylum_brightwellii.AAC.1